MTEPKLIVHEEDCPALCQQACLEAQGPHNKHACACGGAERLELLYMEAKPVTESAIAYGIEQRLRAERAEANERRVSGHPCLLRDIEDALRRAEAERDRLRGELLADMVPEHVADEAIRAANARAEKAEAALKAEQEKP